MQGSDVTEEKFHRVLVSLFGMILEQLYVLAPRLINLDVHTWPANLEVQLPRPALFVQRSESAATNHLPEDAEDARRRIFAASVILGWPPVHLASSAIPPRNRGRCPKCCDSPARCDSAP